MDGSQHFFTAPQSDQSDAELSPEELEMISMLPDSLETSHPTTEFDLFELAVNLNHNLYDPPIHHTTDLNIDDHPDDNEIEMITTLPESLEDYLDVQSQQCPTESELFQLFENSNFDESNDQHGGVLNNSDSDDRPNADNVSPTGSVDSLSEGVRSREQRLNPDEIDRLLRSGGFVNGYHITPRPRFNGATLRRTMNLREINSTDLIAYHSYLHDMLNDIVAFARDFGGDGAVINLTLSAPTLQSPAGAVLTSGNNYDPNLLFEQIEKILQSNDQLLSDTAVEIEASVVQNRQGGGRRKLTDHAVDQVVKRKKSSLFCPTNISNNLCFSICLARFLNPHQPESGLEKLAAAIQNRVGFSIQDRIGFSDIASFEDELDIKIVVFHRSNALTLESYKNSDEPHPKTVFLYLDNGHYYMILNMPSFIGTSYVCEFCYKGYKDRVNHRCKHVCNICFDPACHTYPKTTVHCLDCMRYCKSPYCFEMHKKNNPPGQQNPACDLIKYCKLCNRRYRAKDGVKKSKHQCAPDKCEHCREILPDGGDHQCFIQPLAAKELSEKYIFYDFETRYENGRHVANFVCAMTFQGGKYVAWGPRCIAKLIKRFRQPRYEGYCFIAHYAAKFDSFLLLEQFCKLGIAIEVIMQGCKLVYMYDPAFKQRYLDSYSFFPMSLSKIPAALDLKTTEKGYFPHLFNTRENIDYFGPYPDKKFYNYDNMSDKDQQKFDSWYSTVQGKFFCFRRQLKEYGINDVILLREGCMKYRSSFIECAGVDPFSFTTIASCAMGISKPISSRKIRWLSPITKRTSVRANAIRAPL
nr:TPA_asm: PolB-N [Pimephales minnow adintovirus]